MPVAAPCGHLDAAIDSKRNPDRGVSSIVTNALRRIGDAIYESRRRRAEREIALYIERSGGRLTDDIERQITRRLSSSNFNPHG